MLHIDVYFLDFVSLYMICIIYLCQVVFNTCVIDLWIYARKTASQRFFIPCEAVSADNLLSDGRYSVLSASVCGLSFFSVWMPHTSE